MGSFVFCPSLSRQEWNHKTSGSSTGGIQGRHRKGRGEDMTVLDILMISSVLLNKGICGAVWSLILSGKSLLAEKLLCKVLNPSWRQQGSVTALFQGCTSEHSCEILPREMGTDWKIPKMCCKTHLWPVSACMSALWLVQGEFWLKVLWQHPGPLSEWACGSEQRKEPLTEIIRHSGNFSVLPAPFAGP